MNLFGLNIKDLKGICAQISASVCTRVITFFCPSAIQGPRPVCGGLAASQTGRYAGKRVWEYSGIRWMANDEGTRMKIGWVLEECRALFLSREAWQRLRQVGKSL